VVGGLVDSSVRCLAWGGRLLVVGYASGQIPAIRTNRLMLRNAGVLGVYWSHEKDPTVIAEAVEAILARHAAGKLRFEIGRRYPFERLPDALADLAARRTAGKAVLTIDPSQT
jgi:NADPH:quinone reductase